MGTFLISIEKGFKVDKAIMPKNGFNRRLIDYDEHGKRKLVKTIRSYLSSKTSSRICNKPEKENILKSKSSPATSILEPSPRPIELISDNIKEPLKVNIIKNYMYHSLHLKIN
jgi:hypothetical protein